MASDVLPGADQVETVRPLDGFRAGVGAGDSGDAKRSQAEAGTGHQMPGTALGDQSVGMDTMYRRLGCWRGVGEVYLPAPSNQAEQTVALAIEFR